MIESRAAVNSSGEVLEMRRSVKPFSVVALAVLAGLVLKSDRERAQSVPPLSPIVIKQVSLKDLATSSGTVRLFTPKFGRLYRVSFYTDVTPQSAGCVGVSLSWTDEDGPQTQNSGNACAVVGQSLSNSILVHSVPDQPVDLTASVTSDFNGKYNLFITVEQL